VSYEQTISDVSKAVEVAGIAVLIVGGSYALGVFALRVARGISADSFEDLRRSLGRSILLGLEILVAADIIRTIAITPTFTSVGVLGVIVVVRTFLSFSLEVELDGRWPWHKDGDRQLGRQRTGGDRPDPVVGAEATTTRAAAGRAADLVRHTNAASISHCSCQVPPNVPSGDSANARNASCPPQTTRT
jgi:uncharacterized membrane protein